MKYLLILLTLTLISCSGPDTYSPDHNLAKQTCKNNGGLSHYYIRTIGVYLTITCNNGMIGTKKRTKLKVGKTLN